MEKLNNEIQITNFSSAIFLFLDTTYKATIGKCSLKDIFTRRKKLMTLRDIIRSKK